ncbi:MAG: hypothetical protein MZU84_07515 [Sphingobacterium sp.]|nr:hypothetical protein [Sphingobacterium sp.]
MLEKTRQVILFIDEIHRFNTKGQQDALLGAIEKGYIPFLSELQPKKSFF